MKKLFALLLILTIFGTSVACGKNEAKDYISQTTTKTSTISTTRGEHSTDVIEVEETTTKFFEDVNVSENVKTSENVKVSENDKVSKNFNVSENDEVSKTINVSENIKASEKEPTKHDTVIATQKPSSPLGTEQSKNTISETTHNTKPSSKPNTKPSETTPIKVTESTTHPVPITSVVTSSDIAKIESGFLRLVNEERARMGVQSLNINSTLDAAARGRSSEIINTFSHTRPNGTPFYTIINEDSYPYTQYRIGENIQSTTHMGHKPFTKNDMFVGTDEQITAVYTTMFNNFKNSSGHYANMINGDYYETGVGISYKIDQTSGMAIFYIVQIFGSN